MYNEKISKSTIARKISCLKSLQKYLNINGLEFKLNINRPKTSKKLPVYLSVDEILHLLDDLDPKDLPTKKPLRDIAVLELLYATGVRCSELVNICFNDINLHNRTIRILGKGNKERIVLFGNKAKDKLTSYIEKERSVVYSLSEKIFLNNCNEPITVRTVQRIIEMFRQFLKIERPITPHKIRHSFATHMLNQGVPLRVVQELLGHQSLSSTEIYTHVTTTELKELCDTMHPINTMSKKSKTA
jgi:site-specific recombinase XerD